MNPWEIPTGAVEVVAVRIGICAPVSARSEAVLLDTDRFRLRFFANYFSYRWRGWER